MELEQHHQPTDGLWGYTILLKNQGEWKVHTCEEFNHLPQHERLYEIARDNLKRLREIGEDVRLVALLAEPEDTQELWELNKIN